MMMDMQEQFGCKECIFFYVFLFPQDFILRTDLWKLPEKDKVKKAEACLVRNRKLLA
jgi:hypothetical protein